MTPSPAERRALLVEHLRARGDVRTERVARAFAAVPRHAFLPDIPADEAYADRSIAIKLHDGVAISSSSQPAIMAEMLEMLGLREGDNVLEIGSGSGYNAALLAELVGSAGRVTTVELDADLASRAREHLDATGYRRVEIVCADGAGGAPAAAPFDAVIATVGVERIPPPWIAQLRVGGPLVAPLTIRSLQTVIAFERTPDGLASRAAVDAAFMMLRGPSASSETRVVTLGDPTLTLRVFAARAASLDTAALARAVYGRPYDTRPGQRIAPEDVWDGVALWLALRDDGFCRLSAHGASVQRAHVPNLLPGFDPAQGAASTLGLCSAAELVVLGPSAPGGVLLRRYGEDEGGIAAMRTALAAWNDAGRPGKGNLRVTVGCDGSTHATLSS